MEGNNEQDDNIQFLIVTYCDLYSRMDDLSVSRQRAFCVRDFDEWNPQKHPKAFNLAFIAVFECCIYLYALIFLDLLRLRK